MDFICQDCLLLVLNKEERFKFQMRVYNPQTSSFPQWPSVTHLKVSHCEWDTGLSPYPFSEAISPILVSPSPVSLCSWLPTRICSRIPYVPEVPQLGGDGQN